MDELADSQPADLKAACTREKPRESAPKHWRKRQQGQARQPTLSPGKRQGDNHADFAQDEPLRLGEPFVNV